MLPDHALAPSWSPLSLGLDIELPSQWRAKVPVYLEQANYIIKTADCMEEFLQVISLRSAVFIEEFAGQSSVQRMDFEPRDHDSDFLIIQDRKTREVLASYRLICSEFTSDFYSCTEFKIEDFLRSEGCKIELSRACVRIDKRSKGIFVHLLWRGLAAYAAAVGGRYLFGCSSVQGMNLLNLVRIYRFLQDSGCLDEQFAISPQPGYAVFDRQGFMQAACESSGMNGEELLPPILAAYLKAGAMVYGTPAFDQDFLCLDLFTILDFSALSESHGRKYLRT